MEPQEVRSTWRPAPCSAKTRSTMPWYSKSSKFRPAPPRWCSASMIEQMSCARSLLRKSNTALVARSLLSSGQPSLWPCCIAKKLGHVRTRCALNTSYCPAHGYARPKAAASSCPPPEPPSRVFTRSAMRSASVASRAGGASTTA